MIRKPGPVDRKEKRLRELWEWGVDSSLDRRRLLSFALEEAERFKESTLAASLRKSTKTLRA